MELIGERSTFVEDSAAGPRCAPWLKPERMRKAIAYGQVNRVPEPIEWLTDNGSCYTAASRAPCPRHWVDRANDPDQQSLVEWHGRGVRSHSQKRLCPREPQANAQSVIDQLPGWFAHYNDVHPHRALRYRSTRVHRKNLRGSSGR
jgi:transposase InsO family protein